MSANSIRNHKPLVPGILSRIRKPESSARPLILSPVRTMEGVMRPLSALAIIVLLAITTPARTQEEFIELQIDTSHLRAFFTNQFIAEIRTNFCPTQIPNSSLFVDRIDVLPGSFFSDASDPVLVSPQLLSPIATGKVKYAQPIKVYLKTEACILDPACGLQSYASVVDLTAIVELEIMNGELCATPAGFLENVPFPFPLPTASATCFPLPVDALSGMSGPDAFSAGTALSLSADTSTLALRIEFLPDSITSLPSNLLSQVNQIRQSLWQSYLGGNLAVVAAQGPNDWRVFMTDNLLRGGMRRRFKKVVEDADNLEPLGSMSTTWWPVPGDGRATAAFDVDVDVDECPNTIGAEIDVVIDFSLVGSDLVMDGRLDWNLYDSDVLLCGALFGGFVLAPLTVPIAAHVGDVFTPDPNQLGGVSECTSSIEYSSQVAGVKTDPYLKLDCSFPLPAFGIPDFQLSLDEATPTMDGLALHGAVQQSILLGELSINSVYAGGTLGYGVKGNCGHFSVGYSGGVYVQGPALCNVEIVPSSDPFQVYQINAITQTIGQGVETDIVLGFSSPPSGHPFWQNPYPLLLTLWSNRGAWTLEIPAPSQPYSPGLAAALIIAAEAKCGLQEDFGLEGVFNPEWVIDPPPIRELSLIHETRLDTREIGTVMLSKLDVSLAEQMIDTRGLRTHEVAHTLSGVVLVDAGKFGKFKVEFAVPITVDWAVETDIDDDRLLSTLRSTNDILASVDLSESLPKELFGTGFDLRVEAGAISVLSH